MEAGGMSRVNDELCDVVLIGQNNLMFCLLTNLSLMKPSSHPENSSQINEWVELE